MLHKKFIEVFVYYRYHQLNKNTPLTLSHPLTRRFSPLQKVTLDLLEMVKKEHPADFNQLFLKQATPLFFATAWGEMDAILKEIEAIDQKKFPVSPAAFQHSVQNCVPGYFAILEQLNQGFLTFSSGFLAADKALFWAWHKIQCGLYKGVAVLTGHENLLKSCDVLGQAELLLLTTQPLIEGTTWCLNAMTYSTYNESSTTLTEQNQHDSPFCKKYCENDPNHKLQSYPPFLLGDVTLPKIFNRQVCNLEGEQILSSWEAR